jgi:hypothetical protein
MVFIGDGKVKGTIPLCSIFQKIPGLAFYLLDKYLLVFLQKCRNGLSLLSLLISKLKTSESERCREKRYYTLVKSVGTTLTKRQIMAIT